MQKTIISDTSCLILLYKIGELKILHRLFGTISVTPEINEEYHFPLPNWIIVESPTNRIYQKILEASLDKGEASAIALGVEKANSLLIIDDLKGRKFAEKLGLNVTGTLGVLVVAKRENMVPSVKLILDKIKMTNFRISKVLEKRILNLSGEDNP